MAALEPEIKDFIVAAERLNTLLLALLNHPKFNKSDPKSSPKPLFFVADFARTTYLQYFFPLLPKDAVKKSSRLANPGLFKYDDQSPLPVEENTEWLEDPSNWPSDLKSAKKSELYSDAIGRCCMLALIISDPVKGSMFTGGTFDWKRPVDIAALVQPFMEAP